MLTAAAMVAVGLMASVQSRASGYNAYANYTVASAPYSVAVGDFNNDGIPDLVSANYINGSVSVLLGKGDGTFGSAQTFTCGTAPISVAVGDFNKDGKLDVAVANNNNNQAGGNVAILMGNGDGTLQAAVDYSAQGSPFYVAVADLNGDGSPDVVLAAHGAAVQVFLNTGTGTFATAATYNAGSNPQSVAIADFNKDGILDLAVANAKSNNISVLLGNGDGTFKPAVNYATGTEPSVVGTGDFNADGNIDLAVGNFGSGTVSILLGNGDGTFQTQTTMTSASPSGLVVTDVNGDSIADLVVTNENGTTNTVQTFLGVGNGTFNPPTSYQAGKQPRIVAAADLNHDGAPDLAVASSGGNLNVFMNSGGTYITDVGSPNPASPGQPVTFTATVAYSIAGLGTPTGSVSFYNGTTLLGSGTVGSSGVASYTDSSGFSTAGTYTIYANYSGDANYNPNSAPPLTETVSTGGSPIVTLTPTSLTFAAQLINTTSAAQNVTLMNTGTGTATITGITVTGNFKSPSNTCGSSVQAGASCTISVTFKPTKAGAQFGTLGVSDNASGSPQKVQLSGQGTVISISPSSLTFAGQKVGTTSQPQTVTVTNEGTSSVTISKIDFSGGNLHDFNSPSNTCGTSLAGSSSCTINVTFTPHATGSRASTLLIYDTGGGSPQQVPVSGTGT
ncbi:MAG TPA: FG-GAP-like repeat-containing protein [Terriglobia bacterium]|nr:FG-GAP-like repeat-containing protein [Terriglobia bacterium]